MDFDFIGFLQNMPLKYFGLSIFLFIIGLMVMILNKSNFIKILIGFELMVLSIIINFNLFSSILNDDEGFAFIFIILAIAASEASIGLSIFLKYFRNNRNIDLNQINSLKG
jgi:NADH-quinone oxidoreductase subunit K